MSTNDPAGEDAPWYRTAFESQYLTLYRHRTEEAAGREVAWAAEQLRPPSGSGRSGRPRLLDLACGNGRHARALHARGFTVTGLDYSADLLRAARARPQGPAVGYVRGDMRRLPLHPGFDAVTSFFTSFGYFDDEEDDRRVLAEVRRVLVERGRSLLDFLNAPTVRAQLVPESEEERDGWTIRQRRRISADDRRVEKEVSMRGPAGETRRYTESVRLYELADFQQLLPAAGLEILSVHGDLEGSPFRSDSPRLVLISRRREGR